MRIPILSNIHNNLTMDSKISEIPFSKYPRPSLVRDSYICLNGKWNNNIMVPYPLQSANSGFKGRVPSEFVYERQFSLPKDFVRDKVLLHIDGADCITEVYVNGTLVGTHEGGYSPMVFDISKAVSRVPQSTNSLKIKVSDKLSHKYPYGKQKKRRGGMWYTPVSGIWKSVWLESVSFDYIEALEITPSLTGIDLNIVSEANDYEIEIFDGGKSIIKEHTPYDLVHFDIPNPHLWSPEDPHLYDIVVKTKNDRVKSYFGLRTVSIDKINGISRILLNEKPYFFHGVLDQGYYPQGIYTPNTENDYEEDILRLKKFGINTIRKHIKIEPECFYEACDRLGMIVFQDMVNNGSYRYVRDTIMPTIGRLKRDDSKNRVRDEVKNNFAMSVQDTLVELYNHPSIVYYTIFNEGWGQFDADMMYKWVRSMDRSRIVDSTSGWFWQNLSDVDSYHVYFKDVKLEASDRPIILSEFGGFSLKIKEHSFSRFVNYGYGKCNDSNELTERIVKLYEEQIIPLIDKGLCGTVYTQATDVEDETNGFYTYDRKICKVNCEEFCKLSEKLKIK